MTETPLLDRVHERVQDLRDKGAEIIGVTFNPAGWGQVKAEKDAWMNDPPDAPMVPVTKKRDQYDVFEVQHIPAGTLEVMPDQEVAEIKRAFREHAEADAMQRAQPENPTLGDVLGGPV